MFNLSFPSIIPTSGILQAQSLLTQLPQSQPNLLSTQPSITLATQVGNDASTSFKLALKLSSVTLVVLTFDSLTSFFFFFFNDLFSIIYSLTLFKPTKQSHLLYFSSFQPATPTRTTATTPIQSLPHSQTPPKRLDTPTLEEPSDLEELEQFAKTFKQRRIKLGFTQVCAESQSITISSVIF